ncbi:MAG: hypothetical protein BWX70_02809 [Verrucomicrobia bacterium ADurb.Bin070]|nr:MAG: hypothetical protein BWX70_02809 [Verrucomicrobia bacterium ADurb.Bin070]
MVVPDQQQVAGRGQPLDRGRRYRRFDLRRHRRAPRVAPVRGVREVLATAAGTDEHHHPPVLQLHHARLLRGHALASRVKSLLRSLAAAPRFAVIVRQITHQRTQPVRFGRSLRPVQTHRQHQTSACELDRAVVVQHIVTDLVRDAHHRFAPGLALILRKPHHRAAILLAVLEQVEKRDPAALQAQQADRHHVHAALVRHDHPVLPRPCQAAVGRIAPGQMRRVMIAAAARRVMRVDEKNAPVLERDKRPFAVARVVRPRRQFECPHGNLLSQSRPETAYRQGSGQTHRADADLSVCSVLHDWDQLHPFLFSLH